MGEPKKKVAKIVIDRSRCIGASSCIAIAPDVYELDKENIAVVKDARGADDDTLVLSAQSCPTNAIFLYDEDGNQIYPEQQNPLLSEEGEGRRPAVGLAKAGGGVESA